MALRPSQQSSSQVKGKRPVLEAAASGIAAGVSGGNSPPSPPPPMPRPQGTEGGGRGGGAVGGRVTTRSMTAPPGGAPLAPEGQGPEGVLGDGAAPGLAGGVGWTSSQRPQRESKAPKRLIEEIDASSSQESSGQAARAPPKGGGDHACWVGCKYSEGICQVTQEELEKMCNDFGHALEDVICAMEEAGEVGEGEGAESTSNASEGRNFSFEGFGNAFTMARWRNFEKWLLRDFKVERLLERPHRVFTPTGEVVTQWRAVVRALTTLVLEVMDRDQNEEGYGVLLEKLYILMLSLPILVLRVP